MNFDINKYQPPMLDIEGWDDKFTKLMGRLVKYFGPYYGSGQELFESLGSTVAEEWQEKDEYPEPTDWISKASRLIGDYYSRGQTDPALPEFGSMVGEGTDVIVVSRYQKAHTPAAVLSMKDALEKEWDFDAHLIPVTGVDVRPLKDDNFKMTYLVFDCDTPDHKPLDQCRNWFNSQVENLEKHTELSQYYAFYTTRNGFRIVYKPERILTKDEFFEMRQMYLHHMSLNDIDVDTACKDFGRLYRLPKVIRDGEENRPSVLHIPENVVKYVGLPKLISNFIVERDENDKPVGRVSLPAKTIIKQILTCTGGWPKKAGGQLFYLDEDGDPLFIDTSSDLLSWLWVTVDDINICEKAGYITKGELFGALKNKVESYETINLYPFVPRNPRAYVLEQLPDVCHDEGHLDTLLNFFFPDSEADKILLKAAFCTPLSNFGARPVFTLDSCVGRGAGKTTVVKMIGHLYKGLISVSPFEIRKGIVNNTANKFLNAAGRKRRVALIDNVTGFFKSDAFAEVVTSDSIAGRLPYAKDIVERKNDLTWYVTSNDANYDKDFISRSLFIFLKAHKRVDGWENRVKRFIDQHREQILKEIETLLLQENEITIPTATRFYGWESNVLQSCCSSDKQYQLVLECIEEGKDRFDGDEEICSEILDTLTSHIKDQDKNYLVVRKDLFKACDLEMGYHAFRSIVSEGIKQGKLGKLTERKKYGGRSTGKQGKYVWLWGEEDEPEALKIGGFFR